jgi:hypothetical protein
MRRLPNAAGTQRGSSHRLRNRKESSDEREQQHEAGGEALHIFR